jgi:pyruvate/2-oxoacid:ferredoxin oxidoreductase beta subunit/Pyruvate/2-oxoacid:ferredoxin oxidoreductase gamma subunit
MTQRPLKPQPDPTASRAADAENDVPPLEPSPGATTTAAITSYLDESALPYAFCPGCSHAKIVEQLDKALVKLQLDPRRVVIVSDIGCAGIADKYFATNAFHGLHGRSVTYATGIKLANPELHVVVLMGDGGCGIGGHHLINAARRNIGVTVIVFNNLNYGMTGGQYSATTPEGAVTATSPAGHLEHPLDIVGSVATNGASFAARTTAYDAELPDLMARAIARDGFSLLDIWSLCVAYYVPRNKLKASALEDMMESLELRPGVIVDQLRPEYTAEYISTLASLRGQQTIRPQELPQAYSSQLQRPLRLLVAGAAGQRVRSAATALAAGGVLSGLWATRRDDYPITVRTGYSLAEVILSPSPILYTGTEHPDIVAVLAPEGAARVRDRLASLGPDAQVLLGGNVDEVTTPATTRRLEIPTAARSHARRNLSMVIVARLVQELDLYPIDALRQAVRKTQRPEIAELNLAAIDAAVEPPDTVGK